MTPLDIGLSVYCMPESIRAVKPIYHLDLREGVSTPDTVVAKQLAERYRDWLRNALATDGVPSTWILDAIVVVDFEPDLEASKSPQLTYERPFTCHVRLTDDRGRNYEVRQHGWCSAHDPTRECRRGCA
jgi:hypothetical protein